MFFLLYKHTDDSVFDDFRKISDHFPKIFEENAEDFRRLTKTFEEDPKMFR